MIPNVYKVTVHLVFEEIEARNLQHACELAEAWCHPLPKECDGFWSTGEFQPRKCSACGATLSLACVNEGMTVCRGCAEGRE